DLLEAFFTRGLRHTRIHVAVLVRLARDRGLEVRVGRTDRQTGGRIADGLEVLEVAVRMSRLAFGGRAEHGRNVVVAFHVRLGSEVEIAAIRLRLAREGVLEVLLGLAALEFHASSENNAR